jgi:hypothetical protein
MGYTSIMTTPRSRRARLLLALAGLALAASGGCGSDPEQTTPFSPDLIAVTGPDSLPAGQPLDLKIHWFSTDTCQELSEFRFYQSDDSTFTLVASGVTQLGVPCDARPNPAVEVGYRIDTPPARRFYVEVVGAHQRFLLGVHGGTVPAAIERHRVSVRSVPPGVPADSAVVTYLGAAGDTLGAVLTASDGTGEISLPCPPGGTRVYRVDVLGDYGRRVLLQYDIGPARCGLPDVLLLNL